ncbi:MAG: Fe-S-containing protein [Treponema sp.]|nr:Fe-S-containing protein [Treponema sp.]
MLRYLILVVENSLALAILGGLLFGGAHKKGGFLWKPMMQGGLLGTVLALILAILRRTTAFINRGYWNLWILSVAIITGILFILLYWDRGRTSIPRSYTPVFGRVSLLLMGALFFYTLPTLFLYPTEFVLTGESIFSTDFLFKLIGYGLGLGISLLVGIGVFKAGIPLSPRFVGSLLTLGLILNMVNQATTIVQFLLARRMIPMIRWLFRIVVAAAGYNLVVLYLLMGMGFFLALVLWIQSLRPPEGYRNPAEHRKIKATMRNHRRWSGVVTGGYLVSILILTGLKAYNEREVILSPAEPMTIQGDEILIPLEQVQDGRLHRFAYITSDNTEVRFIVIKKNAVAYGVGLDACDICGATGYYERKNEVICRLCDVVMNKSTIGFKGGCNPVPLPYTNRSGNMIITIANLEAEQHRFK